MAAESRAPGLSRSVPLPGAALPAAGVRNALEFLAAVKQGGTVTAPCWS